MDLNMNTLKGIIAILATYATYLFGDLTEALGILVAMVVIDYVTGLIRGYITKTLSSSTGFRGLLRKVMILFGVILGHMLDVLLKQGDIFKTLFIYLFCANEGLSIVENLTQCGVPIPNQIIDALEKLKNTTNTNIQSKTVAVAEEFVKEQVLNFTQKVIEIEPTSDGYKQFKPGEKTITIPLKEDIKKE